MRARAPGKLVLTGAYAVLEGAPAIVLAVDRHAVADTSRTEPNPSAEVREALGEAAAPSVDCRALYDGAGHKLGLGSSAAVLVATLGALAAARGQDLAAPGVRDDLFRTAKEAHARTQQGGSGIDVAASVYGGVLRYERRAEASRPATLRAAKLPEHFVVSAFYTGGSMRTSDLLARIEAFKARDHVEHEARIRALCLASESAANAVDSSDAPGLVAAARAMSEGLLELGRAADAPIFTAAMSALARHAASAGAAFLPSGAGGGDVAVHVSTQPPTQSFVAAAVSFGMTPLSFGLDYVGVRADPQEQNGVTHGPHV